MKKEDFDLARKMLWDDNVSHYITTNIETSRLLSEELKNVGVNVVSFQRKYRSPNKFLLFTIKVFKVKGTEIKFMSTEDAKNWHKSKSMTLGSLTKAPDEAFEDVQLEEGEDTIWWAAAFNLAYRLGAPLEEVNKEIIKYRGAQQALKFGI